MRFCVTLVSLSAAWVLSIPAYSQDGNLETLVEKSRLAMKESRWEQALDFNTQAVARFGQDQPLRKYGAQFGAILYQKGVCEMKLKHWREAARSFEICYRDFPNEGADRGNAFQRLALLKWGEAAMGAENWELALSRFAKFGEERDPARDAFPRGAFHINLAVCHYKLGRIPEGNENLEIAIRNKADFPTPESGIVAGFQGLVEAALARRDEQALLDFIWKNRGGLVIGPEEMQGFSEVFLKLAGDALAAGMRRSALAVYQFVPSTEAEAPEIIKLAAMALIHEKSGNVRGAFAAYLQLERWFPKSGGREVYLYHLVRTASLVGEADCARLHAGRLLKDFPKSPRLAEIRAAGIGIPEDEPAAAPVKAAESGPPAKPLPATREFAAAIDLYQGRKYVEARAAFAEIGERAKSGNGDAAAFAAFYETECLRKLGDLDGLAAAVRILEKNPALGGNRLRQLEIDALWDAVRAKEWTRIESLAQDLLRQRLPGDQRAQAAYCHGLALENTARPLEALNAYNLAMTADAGASEEISRSAALQVLGIHLQDAGVRESMAKWGTPDEDPASPGFPRLLEAASVAALFELSLGAGTPLPAEFQEFLRFAKVHPDIEIDI